MSDYKQILNETALKSRRIRKQTTTGAVHTGLLPTPRGRGKLRQADPKPPKPGPVTVRPIEREWSKEDAKRLIKQGYTVEHVAKFTGWPVAVLRRG